METVTPRRCSWGKELLLATADTAVCWLCFSFLTDYFFSIYAERLALSETFFKIFGVLMLLCLCIVTISHNIVLNHQPARRRLGIQFLLHIPAHGLMLLLMLLNMGTVRIRIFPIGDFDDYYGVAYIYSLGFYCIVSILLRLGVLVIHLMRLPKND